MRPDFRLLVKNSWLRIGDISFVRFVGVVRKNTSTSDQKWKEALVGDASQRMAKLPQDTGNKADVSIGSGDAPKFLSPAAKQDGSGFAGHGVLSLWR
jgi:hypothetical protein